MSAIHLTRSIPGAAVLRGLSKALGTTVAHLVEVEFIEVEIRAYRKKARMGKREMARGAAVVIRRGLPGERQRLGLTHELGHLVLEVGDQVHGEKAVLRFGAAMLAPASAVRREVGERRRRVDMQELLLLNPSACMLMRRRSWCVR
jgi:hypothetical protein